jgi:hypothetical protein
VPLPAGSQFERFDIETPPQPCRANENAYGIIIGNRDYESVPRVDYALNDAKLMEQYFVNMFGIPPRHIIGGVHTNLKIIDLKALLGSREAISDIENQIKYPQQSELYIYYSGHGIPLAITDDYGNTKYISAIIGIDYKSDHRPLYSYRLDELYANLQTMGFKRVTIFIEACFSGQSGDPNNPLTPYESAAGLDTELLQQANFAKFRAAGADQIANSDPVAGHGIFTAVLLEGLQSRADMNADGQITNGEMANYLDANVSNRARRLPSKPLQNPSFMGDSSKVMVDIH